jgi:undecaprenyl-diphosphatase
MSSEDVPTRQKSRARRLLRAAVFAVAVSVVLFGVGYLVRSRWGPLQSIDEDIISASTAYTREHPGFREALVVWQEVTQPINLYAVGTLLCLWVWLRQGLRTRAWWCFATMMVAWNLGLVAKLVVQRSRPVVEDPVSEAPGFSFPSGHALNAAAWATLVVILLWPVVKPALARGVMLGLAVAVILVTALDRVWLGVHYPSDVTVGVITGTGLALASYAGYSGWNPPHPTTVHDPDTETASRGSVPSTPTER